MVRILLGGLVLSVISACVAPEVPADLPDVVRQIDAEAPVSGLPAQRLAPNECGLFLWSKTDTSRFVFFAKAGTNDALFLLEDRPTELRAISLGGDIFGQFFTETVYTTSDGREISLSYQVGEDLKDGARISNGTLQYSDDDGWLTVIPVLGVRVCQPVAPDTHLKAPSDSDLQ